MDGTQFRVLKESLTQHFRIIGFHLPYHKNGPSSHHLWINDVKSAIKKILTEQGADQFSLAGYSVGSKVTLHLIEAFQEQLEEIFLFAPYGLENHWGLSFVTQKFGNTFFKLIVNTSLPEKIMRLVKFLGIIDKDHHQIIHKELLSDQKRVSLCKTLQMAGEININRNEIPKILNRNKIKSTIIYGKDDVLFPFKKRSKAIINQLDVAYVDQVKEGHWMVTGKLDRALANNLAL